MRQPTHIMLHHSATVDQVTFDTAAIRRFHTSWRFDGKIITAEEARKLVSQGRKGVIPPWRKIGYHRLVEIFNGEVEVVVGRGDHESAAACPQGEMNERALHICIVGNFDATAPSDQVIRAAIERAVAPWRMVFGIPVERVVGHRDYNPQKSCPGSKFDLDLFREMLR